MSILMKKLYLVLVVLVITLILLPFLPQKIIASETTVTAAVPLHFPPYYMLDEHGKPDGFAIDLMNEVAKLSGFKIEYIVKDSWTEVNNALINQSVDLTEKILRIRHDIPIIMCTGFSEIMNEEKAKAIGVREFVMKPLIKSKISKTVRQVLDTGKMQDG